MHLELVPPCWWPTVVTNSPPDGVWLVLLGADEGAEPATLRVELPEDADLVTAATRVLGRKFPSWVRRVGLRSGSAVLVCEGRDWWFTADADEQPPWLVSSWPARSATLLGMMRHLASGHSGLLSPTVGTYLRALEARDSRAGIAPPAATAPSDAGAEPELEPGGVGEADRWRELIGEFAALGHSTGLGSLLLALRDRGDDELAAWLLLTEVAGTGVGDALGGLRAV